MCACVHVCMCACVHVCMCACVHVCMCACVHVCMCTRIMLLCCFVFFPPAHCTHMSNTSNTHLYNSHAPHDPTCTQHVDMHTSDWASTSSTPCQRKWTLMKTSFLCTPLKLLVLQLQHQRQKAQNHNNNNNNNNSNNNNSNNNHSDDNSGHIHRCLGPRVWV